MFKHLKKLQGWICHLSRSVNTWWRNLHVYINESLKFFSKFDNKFNLRLHHHYEIVKTHMIKDASEPVNCVFRESLYVYNHEMYTDFKDYTIIAQCYSLENLPISKIKPIYIKLYFQNSISRRLIYKWNDQYLTIF